MKPATSKNRLALLRQAKRVIEARYAEYDIGLVEIADDIGTSSRQLQRVFAEFEDESFRAYLLRVRMNRARTLLSRERNPLSIRATAPRVGYRGASGLRQAFKRHFGINPSEVQPEPRRYLGDVFEPE